MVLQFIPLTSHIMLNSNSEIIIIILKTATIKKTIYIKSVFGSGFVSCLVSG